MTARRPVSLTQVAAHAGVSIATVSRVVNGVDGRVTDETSARVRRAVDELGYHPDSIGRALRHRQTRVVALLAPNLANPAMAAIAAATEDALRAEGHVMLLCDTHDRPEIQDEYLLAMRAQMVRAIVMLGAVASPGLDAFRSQGNPPLLFVNRRDPGRDPDDAAAAFVGIDNRAAGADAADFFLGRGLAAPTLIHSALWSSAIADRVAGFLDRLAARGVDLGAVRRIGRDGLDHLSIGYDAMAEVVAAGRAGQGVMCLSDLIAYGAYRRATEAGIAVPQGCLIAGIDDNPVNDWIAPWLTSIHVPYDRYGAAIVAGLADLWAGREAGARLLDHTLVVRPR